MPVVFGKVSPREDTIRVVDGWVGGWMDGWMETCLGNGNGGDNSFLYYLCCGTTATKPITDMAQGYKENTSTNANIYKWQYKLHLRITL